MANIFKLIFTVFIIAFSSLSSASGIFYRAIYPQGIVFVHSETGIIIQCTSNFGVVTPTTKCKKIGSAPVPYNSSSSFDIEIVGGVNKNAIIFNPYTGVVTQCTLLPNALGSCKTDSPPYPTV